MEAGCRLRTTVQASIRRSARIVSPVQHTKWATEVLVSTTKTVDAVHVVAGRRSFEGDKKMDRELQADVVSISRCGGGLDRPTISLSECTVGILHDCPRRSLYTLSSKDVWCCTVHHSFCIMVAPDHRPGQIRAGNGFLAMLIGDQDLDVAKVRLCLLW